MILIEVDCDRSLFLNIIKIKHNDKKIENFRKEISQGIFTTDYLRENSLKFLAIKTKTYCNLSHFFSEY
jgi:hypothetical protein